LLPHLYVKLFWGRETTMDTVKTKITDDLAELFAAEPEIIICGTGAMGVMQPSAELQKYIENSSIRFIVQKSGKAVETYNQLSGREKVGACFHLTC
jgi:hypothetical protein